MRTTLFGLWLTGCVAPVDGPSPDDSVGGGTTVDLDGDGSPAALDCDDEDVGSAPGFAEIRCDGRDNDCTGGDDRTGCVVTEDRAAFELVPDPGTEFLAFEVLGDVDGDGADDLAAMYGDLAATAYVVVLTAVASGAPRRLEIPGALWAWPAGDVDGDGDRELWVASSSLGDRSFYDTLRLVDPPAWSGTAAAEDIGFDQWGFQTINEQWLQPTDANGDRLDDLIGAAGVCAAPFTEVRPAVTCQAATGGWGPQVVDWDGDGAFELSTNLGADGYTANGTVALRVGPIAWDAVDGSVPTFADHQAAFADFDADGQIDALSPQAELFAPVEARDYRLADRPQPSATRPGLDTVSARRTGDIDGDGAAETLGSDLLSQTTVLARVLPGRAVEALEAGWRFDIDGDLGGLLADLDGDGLVDVLMYMEGDRVLVFSGAAF